MTVHTSILVTWKEGVREDSRPVNLKTSWLPRVLGAQATTIGRVGRFSHAASLLNMLAWARLIRHELIHVWQFEQILAWFQRFLRKRWLAYVPAVVWYLLKYLVLWVLHGHDGHPME